MSRRSSNELSSMEPVDWDKYTFNLPKKPTHSLTGPEKNRYFTQVVNSLDAASAPSLTKVNVFESRFEHEGLLTEINGSFRLLLDTSQGLDAPIKLNNPTAFAFSDIVLRNRDGNTLALNAGNPIAPPTRAAARYLNTDDVPVDPDNDQSKNPDDSADVNGVLTSCHPLFSRPPPMPGEQLNPKNPGSQGPSATQKKTIQVGKKVYRPKMGSLYEDPDLGEDMLDGMEVIFTQFGKSLRQKIEPLGPRDDVIMFDASLHQKEIDRNIRWDKNGNNAATAILEYSMTMTIVIKDNPSGGVGGGSGKRRYVWHFRKKKTTTTTTMIVTTYSLYMRYGDRW